MSRLSNLLSNRLIVPIVESDELATVTLADLTPGCGALISNVCDDADPATARRLVDLGFRPGAEVLAVRRAPTADPTIYRVAGYEVALRRVQARCIRVLSQP